jgi:hypothetical protein
VRRGPANSRRQGPKQSSSRQAEAHVFVGSGGTNTGCLPPWSIQIRKRDTEMQCSEPNDRRRATRAQRVKLLLALLSSLFIHLLLLILIVVFVFLI